tara:strand:- start:3727 stop:4917 length:1191 start_codon:yes stop_codon:yes gene_type:complete
MADKIDNKIFQSMLTSADSDATKTWQESYIDKPTIPKRTFNLSREEHGLSEEDLFNLVEGVTGGPMGSIKSIKAIASKLKDNLSTISRGTKSLFDAFRLGNLLVVDDIALKVLPKPTKEFINKAKNRLFEDLGSYDAWKRWKNTMGIDNVLGYKEYRSHIKKSLDLFSDKDLTYMDDALSGGDMKLLGQYWSDGLKKGMVEINPYKHITQDLHSIGVHEYAHKTQLAPPHAPTKLTGGTVLEGGARKRFGWAEDMPYLGDERHFYMENNKPAFIQRPLGFEWELKYWDKIKPYFTDKAKKALPEIEKWANIDPNFAPKDIKFIKYLLRPREISARMAQLREGTAPEWVMRQLESILTPEGIEFAKKNLWGGAGIGAFNQMIDSSSDPADNLFKDGD